MFKRFYFLLLRLSLPIQIFFWVFLFIFSYTYLNDYIDDYKLISNFNSYYFQKYVGKNKVSYRPTTNRPEDWVELKNISKKLIGAIVVSEDGKFFYHRGIDVEELQKVIIEKYIYHKKKVRGASTITQQLVKNILLSNEKTISRKVQEIFFANALEESTNKEKILESYLNVIEFGKGIFGIKHASLFYFNKAPANLSAKESAFLAMLLPNPVKYSRSFYNHALTPYASSIISSVLFKMLQAGYLNQDEYEKNLSTNLIFESIDNVTEISNQIDRESE